MVILGQSGIVQVCRPLFSATNLSLVILTAQLTELAQRKGTEPVLGMDPTPISPINAHSKSGS